MRAPVRYWLMLTDVTYSGSGGGGGDGDTCSRSTLNKVAVAVTCDPYQRVAFTHGPARALSAAQASTRAIAHDLGSAAKFTQTGETTWRYVVDLPDDPDEHDALLQHLVRLSTCGDDDPDGLYLDCCAGFAVGPHLPAATTDHDLAEYASAALSLCLRSTDRIRFAENESRAEVRDGLTLAHRLRLSSAADFPLVYQPIVRLSDRQVMGFEALLRWRPDQDVLTPDHFMEEAEASSLILDIGLMTIPVIIETFANTLAPLCASDEPFVTINLSSRQLTDPALAGYIGRTLDNFSVDPGRLWIELREDAAIQNDSSTSKVIDQLHQLGCRISIDDLGSGYSALSYIRDLPVDVLKIDRDLINQVTCDPVSAAVVDAICQMCKAVGIHIVAEGIESEDILRVLHGFGIGYGQGYLFGHPTAAAALAGRTATAG